MKNENKLKYEEPKMSIAFFETKDVLTTSGFPGEIDPIADDDRE